MKPTFWWMGNYHHNVPKTFNVTSIVECIGHLQVEEELGSTFLGVEKKKLKVEMKTACPKKLMIKMAVKNNS
jgi:hypothetical protein